jgi:hypothetical protein
LTHSEAGSTSFDDRLARHHGGAGLGLARSDHAVDRRHQAQAAALRAQRLQVGLRAGLILTHGGQRGEGELQVLAARGQQLPR